MTSPAPRPALTPEEWSRRATADGAVALEGGALRLAGPAAAERRHALAALALLEQPFGFTWADVRLVEEAAAAHGGSATDEYERLRELAERLRALLPPRVRAPESAEPPAGGQRSVDPPAARR